MKGPLTGASLPPFIAQFCPQIGLFRRKLVLDGACPGLPGHCDGIDWGRMVRREKPQEGLGQELMMRPIIISRLPLRVKIAVYMTVTKGSRGLSQEKEDQPAVRGSEEWKTPADLSDKIPLNLSDKRKDEQLARAPPSNYTAPTTLPNARHHRCLSIFKDQALRQMRLVLAPSYTIKDGKQVSLCVDKFIVGSRLQHRHYSSVYNGH